ncbi:MAG: asparagine synthase (glutamine-hydrolyzing) [Bdellovibrionales bacterium]|nr:asparagine synthase (glutamine-hydrolyzing) [Bdellovibrionales bacterium]
MCGIAGIVSWQTSPREQDISNMCEAMIHRGPDAGDIYLDQNLALGQRRLSIIDLSSGANQPFIDSSGRYIITYNGEVYNFKELKKRLIAKGVSFRTSSDTEVVLEAFKEWGATCVEEFNGMFAFAIWDKVEKELFLARDRLGKKPLFYSLLPDGGIIFASEMKALLKHPAISKKINYYALHQYLALSYSLTSQAFLVGVEKLPPAHWLKIKQGAPPHLEEYWDLATCFLEKQENISFEQATEDFLNLFDDAVKIRMISDVPLGAFLSGGIDSSSVVASMCAQRSAKQNHTFSIGFKEEGFSELAEANLSADFLNVSHHSKEVTPQMAELLSKIVYYADEPFADTSIIPMYFLAQFTRENVTVALSGDGADEIFAGYETYVADKLHSYFSFFPKFINDAIYQLYSFFTSRDFGKVSTDYKIRQFLKGASFDPIQAHYSWREIFSPEERRSLLKEDLHWCLSEADPLNDFKFFANRVEGASAIDVSMYTDIKTWLADDILVKVDRSTMAHSLEARAPFLDYRVVEFAARLPISFKLKGFEKKVILKKSQESRLPTSILRRKKSGFNAPVSYWLENALSAYCDQLLDNSADVFNKQAIYKLISDHKNKKADNSFKLFTLICYNIWEKSLG